MPTDETTKKEVLLIVDDDEDLRTQMKWGLSKEYRVVEAADRQSALTAFAEEQPDVVTLDLGLPPDPDGVREGFTTLDTMLNANSKAKVIIITGRDERKNALKALEEGAYDFLAKPLNLEDLRIILKRAFYISNLEKDHRELKSMLAVKHFENMLGMSPQINNVYEKIRKVGSTGVPVLIMGESGTGKELAAQAIHNRSNRKEAPFIAINCGAIPENLLESELFGHEKGAFTGAHAQRKGRFELAHNGTLFLDEIGELPLALQVKLLRFLQDQRIERIGGRESIQVDVRILAATNKDLSKLIKVQEFREDLYYRLGVVIINMPPLRDRAGDILILANAFLQRFSSGESGKPMTFTKSAEKALEIYPWPGNIREMENRIKRAVIMAGSRRITPEDLELADDESFMDEVKSLKEARENFERQIISNTLAKNGGNLSKTAKQLGISRPTLYDLINKLEIQRNQ